MLGKNRRDGPRVKMIDDLMGFETDGTEGKRRRKIEETKQSCMEVRVLEPARRHDQGKIGTRAVLNQKSDVLSKKVGRFIKGEGDQG